MSNPKKIVQPKDLPCESHTRRSLPLPEARSSSSPFELSLNRQLSTKDPFSSTCWSYLYKTNFAETADDTVSMPFRLRRIARSNR
jgi:hypothetical protein